MYSLERTNLHILPGPDMAMVALVFWVLATMGSSAFVLAYLATRLTRVRTKYDALKREFRLFRPARTWSPSEQGFRCGATDCWNIATEVLAETGVLVCAACAGDVPAVKSAAA